MIRIHLYLGSNMNVLPENVFYNSVCDNICDTETYMKNSNSVN